MGDFLDRVVSHARGSGVTAVPPPRPFREPLPYRDADERPAPLRNATTREYEPATTWPRQGSPGDATPAEKAATVPKPASARTEEPAAATRIVVHEPRVEQPAKTPASPSTTAESPTPSSPVLSPARMDGSDSTAVTPAPAEPAVREPTVVKESRVVAEARPADDPAPPLARPAAGPVSPSTDLPQPVAPAAVAARPRSPVPPPRAELPAPAAEGPPAVHIHIGRVDIRAAEAESAVEQRVPIPAGPAVAERAVLSLSDYLHSRTGEVRP